jgi:hypothetical protein
MFRLPLARRLTLDMIARSRASGPGRGREGRMGKAGPRRSFVASGEPPPSAIVYTPVPEFIWGMSAKGGTQ